MSTKTVKPEKNHPLTPLVKRTVKTLKLTYGLPNWPVFFEFIDELPAEHLTEDEGISADIQVLAHSCEVWLRIRKDIKREAVPRILAHELAHWMLHEVDAFVLSLIPKGDTGDSLVRYYKDHLLEPAVERIALATLGPSVVGKEPFQPIPAAGRPKR